MTPKEKAQEMYNQFLDAMPHPETTNAAVNSIAKKCALIAVDEIIKSNAMLPPNLNWLEVKKEIENL
jgi:hypothetical protein